MDDKSNDNNKLYDNNSNTKNNIAGNCDTETLRTELTTNIASEHQQLH